MLQQILEAFSNFRFRSIFFRIWLLLLVLVIVPIVLIGLLGNWYSQLSIQEEVEHSSVQMLEQTRRLMDVLLNDLDEWAIRLAQSDAFLSVLEDGADARSVNDDLLDLYINSPYVESVYVYYEDRHTVQAPLLGTTAFDEFGDTGWFPYYETMDKDGEWIVRDYDSGPLGSTAGTPIVTLIRAVPVLGERKQGAIIINMNQQALFQSPSLRLLRDDEEIWMVSPDGQFAFSNKTGYGVDPKEFEPIRTMLRDDVDSFIHPFRGSDYAFASVVSPYTGWRYVDVLPVDSLHGRSRQVQTFMLLLAAFSAAAAAILAFLAAAKIYTPFRSLLNLFRHGEAAPASPGAAKAKRTNELDVLVSEIHRMSERTSELQHRLREHMPVLRHSFLHQLLEGRAEPPEKCMETFEYLEMKPEPFGYFVQIYRIDDYDGFTDRYPVPDQSLIRYFIAKLAEETYEQHGLRAFPLFADGRDIVVIGNLGTEEQRREYEALSVSMAETLAQLIQQYLQWSVSVGIGTLQASPADIRVSFGEAKKALEIRAFRGVRTIAAYWEVQRERPEGVELLDRLREARQGALGRFKDGTTDALAEELSSLNSIARSAEGVPFGIVQHAFYQLLIDVLERGIDFGMPADAKVELAALHEAVFKQETAESLADTVVRLVLDMKDRYDAYAQGRKSPAVMDMMAYIEANFQKDISLGGIADHLHLDPSYISRLFKQQINVNFTDYVIALRMNKAKELLAGSAMTVKEIGAAVGYENQRSFNRIFKKSEGITPGEYRDKHAPAKLDRTKVY